MYMCIQHTTKSTIHAYLLYIADHTVYSIYINRNRQRDKDSQALAHKIKFLKILYFHWKQ